MAQCEKCQKNGYDPKVMAVDPVERIFLGPCCTPRESFDPLKLNYGLEISNRQGIVLYAEYEGLTLQYHKSPEEIQSWFKTLGRPKTQEPIRQPVTIVRNSS